jgi:hypothetical protein
MNNTRPADLACHANDIWELIFASTRPASKSPVNLLLADIGELSSRRPLYYDERHILFERAMRRFERTFFGA